jgi:hypothetical protein
MAWAEVQSIALPVMKTEEMVRVRTMEARLLPLSQLLLEAVLRRGK